LPHPKPLVGLFATCLVDLFRPTIGFAAAHLLEQAGCEVIVPEQTCCGQPAFNSGDKRDAQRLAQQIIETFESCDYIVAPSGSCGGMMARHYPELFKDDPQWQVRAQGFADKCHELVSFLTDVMGVSALRARHLGGSVTYHDSCSGLRELGVKAQPRALLAAVGAPVVEMAEPEICCGFGGTFCVKYPEISVRMVSDKTKDIAATGASTVLAGDMGCLLNIAGRLSREGHRVQARHVAEVLAGMTDQVPPIGEPGR